MTQLTLGNPVFDSTRTAVAVNQSKIGTAGVSLSTGRNAALDVVSAFVGNKLSDTASVLSVIQNNISYSTNALDTAKSSLSGVAKTLTDMIAIIAQSTGSDKVDTYQSMLDKKIEQLLLQVDSAEFDGRKMFDGALGKDATVTAKFDTMPVSVSQLATVNTLGNGSMFAAAGTKGEVRVTVAGPAAGETVQFGNVTFKAVAGDPVGENEFKIGSTDVESARNLAMAISSHSSESLKAYKVDMVAATAVVSITQVAASDRGIKG